MTVADTSVHEPQQFEYKAEMKQLLHLIIHSLYTHNEIFLRELISNGSDALNKIRFRQLTDSNVLTPEAPLKIDITLDEEGNGLVIEDTGIGMTYEDLTERLGTVASSGTLAFLEQLKQSDSTFDAETMIGQFGVGFYSVFMVAEEVVIDTRHADPDSKGYRWVSDGQGTYTIEEIDRPVRGTRIFIKLKEDAKEFSKDYRVKQIIKKYSNFVDFPINLAGEQVNTVKALWRKSKSDITDEERNEFYKFISNDFKEPLGHLHLSLEGRVNVKALLFIPSAAPPNLFQEEYQRRLHLYSSNVFIQDDSKELLPEYLRFVSGVVDTEDLPLNVSREVTQASPAMTKLNTLLTKRVIGLLEGWAKTDTEKFNAFYKEFGSLFKTGLNSDFTNKDKIVDLLRFESTKTEKGEYVSLKEYVGRMAEGQTDIYYLMGEHRDVVERNPNLEYFRRNDIEVLLLTDPVDVFTMPYLFNYDEKPLTSIEKADLDLKKDEELEKDALEATEAKGILAKFKAVLGDNVEDVIASKRLVDSAVTLVVGKTGMDTQMERMMRLMNQDVGTTSKKILEVNMAHPLVKNLAKLTEQNADDARVEKAMLQLFEGALLIDGNLNQTAAFVERMTAFMVDATKAD